MPRTSTPRPPEQRAPHGGLFRLAVDRSFTLSGLGTAVTGTVLSGSVRVDDRVVVSPSGLEARIRSINAQNSPVERGEAGQRCALVLSGPHISKEAVRRGDVVLDPALHAPTSRIDASLRVLPSEPCPRPVVPGQGASCRGRGAGPRGGAARQADRSG